MKYPKFNVLMPDGTVMCHEGEMSWPFSVAQRYAQEVHGTVKEQFT